MGEDFIPFYGLFPHWVLECVNVELSSNNENGNN
jgi:hypothetical protein